MPVQSTCLNFSLFTLHGSVHPRRHVYQQCREPNPDDFTDQYFQTAFTKELHSNWRYLNRPQRKKVTLGAERSQQRHTKAAVRHGIKQWMRQGNESEVEN